MTFQWILLCAIVATTMALPIDPTSDPQPEVVHITSATDVGVETTTPVKLQPHPHDQIVIVSEDPEKEKALVRKARQFFQGVDIDIFQGGYGGYGGYGGFPGYGGFGGGYGGFPGYGGFGGGYGGFPGYGGFGFYG